MRSKGALLVTNALGASENESGPSWLPIPALPTSVTPRPAHTGPSFAPYGNDVLITVPKFPGAVTSLSLWNFFRSAQGPAESEVAIRVMTRGDNPRMDHGCSASIPATCSTRT